MDLALSVTPPMNQILKNFRVKKDSCIDFKLGKQNILTGKTDSVQNVASTKVSVGNNIMKGVSKTSKFTARSKLNAQTLN